MCPVHYIYINDSFHGMPTVSVPVERDQPDLEVPGLLLADDAVLMTETQEELKEALDSYTVWCDKWRMEVGATKCGVMCVHDSDAHEQLKATTWKLQRQSIPVVEQYKYLGMQIDCSISMRAMVGGRQTIGNTRLAAMGPFLSNRRIPCEIKAKAVSSILLPGLTYGSATYGLTLETYLRKIRECIA